MPRTVTLKHGTVRGVGRRDNTKTSTVSASSVFFCPPFPPAYIVRHTGHRCLKKRIVALRRAATNHGMFPLPSLVKVLCVKNFPFTGEETCQSLYLGLRTMMIMNGSLRRIRKKGFHAESFESNFENICQINNRCGNVRGPWTGYFWCVDPVGWSTHGPGDRWLHRR